CSTFGPARSASWPGSKRRGLPGSLLGEPVARRRQPTRGAYAGDRLGSDHRDLDRAARPEHAVELVDRVLLRVLDEPPPIAVFDLDVFEGRQLAVASEELIVDQHGVHGP